MEQIKSLANGVISTTGVVAIYSCPNNTQAITTLISFTNKSASSVTLNIYKQNKNTTYLISPNNFSFGANYLAQETDPITLSAGDKIMAQCSEANKVEYVINGKEYYTAP